MNTSEKRSQGSLTVRVLIGLLGLTLSVVLHELFHVLMHWGHINHISFFPTPTTLVEINAWLPPGYDLEGEEIVAYIITLLVMLITTIIIFKIRDTDDKRSTGQILFPGDKGMQRLSPQRMLELSGFDDETPPPRRKRKAR